eukprot:gene8989-16127_t
MQPPWCTLPLVSLLFACQLFHLLSAYPEIHEWQSCEGQPNMKDKGHWIFYHANLAMGDMSAAMVWELQDGNGDGGGVVTTSLCPGYRHMLKVQFSVPGSSSSPEPRRALLTSTTPGLNFSEETGSSVVLRDSCPPLPLELLSAASNCQGSRLGYKCSVSIDSRTTLHWSTNQGSGLPSNECTGNRPKQVDEGKGAVIQPGILHMAVKAQAEGYMSFGFLSTMWTVLIAWATTATGIAAMYKLDPRSDWVAWACIAGSLVGVLLLGDLILQMFRPPESEALNPAAALKNGSVGLGSSKSDSEADSKLVVEMAADVERATGAGPM